MRELYFSVADCCYCIELANDNIDYKALLPSSGAFFVESPHTTPIFRLRVREGALLEESAELEEVGHFDNGDVWHHVWRRPEGGFRFQVDDVDGTKICIMETNADFSACCVQLSGQPNHQKLGLENALMIAFAFAAAQHGVLLMHASVPAKEGKAYLFQGKSGTGKSTHCKLWLQHIEGTELLNDDNPAVRLMPDGQVFVYGTPWSGKTPCYRQERRLAGGFLRLQQAPHNKISRQNKLEAFASVLSSCSTMPWDKLSYDALCVTVSGIVERVPSFFLECLPDEAAAQLSHWHLTQPSCR